MQHCDTLIHARWVVPVVPSGVVLEHAAVGFTNGRISSICPSAQARGTINSDQVIERPHHVLLPGLVNTHCHAAMTLFRGLGDDLPLERWLREVIWPAEGQWVGPELVRDGTRLAIAEMLRAGCTCFSDQYFFPEVVAETAANLHMRAVIGTPVIEFPNNWAASAAECLEKGADLVHDPFADHELITTCFAPHSIDTVSDTSFDALRVIADQLDAGVQMHLHESAQEVADSVARTGERPLQRLQAHGLVNSSLLAVHAVHLTAAEREMMANAGVAVAHCPRSNLKLADGIAEVVELQKAGVTVGIGTDSAASNNMLNMFDEMRTAAHLAKVVSSDAAALPASEALEMATIGGARALGLEQVTGSLEAGKWADVACVDLLRLNSQPVYDPLSQLVHAVQSDQVTDVWVAGRALVTASRLTEIDMEQLFERTHEWRRQIGGGAADVGH